MFINKSCLVSPSSCHNYLTADLGSFETFGIFCKGKAEPAQSPLVEIQSPGISKINNPEP